MDDAKTIGLDHFRAYDLVAVAVDEPVALRGQFDGEKPRRHRLVSLEHFSNPVDKNGEGILDRQAHLDWYALDPETAAEPVRTVELANQFGNQRLTLGDAEMLLVPAEKLERGSRHPAGLDHFKAYRVLEGEAPPAPSLRLEDQFLESRRVRLEIPLFFCVPVSKKHRRKLEEVHNPKAHLTIYRISPREHATKRKVRDQFGEYALTILSTAMLAVPTRKLRWSEV